MKKIYCGLGAPFPSPYICYKPENKCIIIKTAASKSVVSTRTVQHIPFYKKRKSVVYDGLFFFYVQTREVGNKKD